MELLLLVAVALVSGASLPVQAGVNSALRHYVGRPEIAALVSFCVGFLALVAWVLATRQPWPTAAQAGRAPWWMWTGGFIGAFYVTTVVILTPRLGIAATLAISVAGQMATSVALDHFGALGVPMRAFSPGRALGALLLVAGVVLIRR
ncbi:MAG TPA: DMT family transporter [Anaeromyxobacteraceae bacterium]|nr:DMT family transporter [Anaeromyxobacteraceae bacterium]